ncbi:hypothetical protein ERJ75_001036600 [Trypanosoma vivax]|nr:hypothetical protein ERJ75_001036600 [Trypanosoma vivax]
MWYATGTKERRGLRADRRQREAGHAEAAAQMHSEAVALGTRSFVARRVPREALVRTEKKGRRDDMECAVRLKDRWANRLGVGRHSGERCTKGVAAKHEQPGRIGGDVPQETYKKPNAGRKGPASTVDGENEVKRRESDPGERWRTQGFVVQDGWLQD